MTSFGRSGLVVALAAQKLYAAGNDFCDVAGLAVVVLIGTGADGSLYEDLASLVDELF